jgi:hypothetical protein
MGTPPPYIMNQGLCAGQVRYNITNNNLEVYDGNSWHSISQSANIYVSQELEDTVKWAKSKMDEEQRLRNKANLFPSIQDALDELERAKERLYVLDTLCDENELDPAQNAP